MRHKGDAQTQRRGLSSRGYRARIFIRPCRQPLRQWRSRRKLLVRFDDPRREWHRYGFAAIRGRFYFTLGDRQSDLWSTSVEEGR